MKPFRIIKTSLKDSFKSIFRNFSLSMASIMCTAVTLVLVSIALLATYNVNSITKDIEDVLTIVAFIDDSINDTEIENLKEQILTDKNIDKLEYKSKDDIKNELMEDEELKEVLSTLDENPASPTFVIKVKDVKKLVDTAEKIKQTDKITHVKYGETVVNKILSMFDIIRNACIIGVIALILVTAFLISNTIKITIFSRRQEISIMRLVGTSNMVIKFPFLIEGFVLGLIGAVVPVLLTIFGYTYLYDTVGGKLFIELIVLVKPATIVYSVSIVLLIVGAIVGMFGSLRAVKRYLKV